MKAKNKSKSARRFVATIYKLWMMRHLDVPDEVARLLVKELIVSGNDKRSGPHVRSTEKSETRRTKYIPVVATVNGQEARVTLAPAGGGRYRMQLNTALRKAARADAGDEVSVTLRLDRESREPTVPADLRAALKENPEARKVFEKLSTGHRRHIVDWFDSARGMNTRIRRLGFTIDFLLKRARGGSMSRRGRREGQQEGSGDRKLPG
jgi:Bacteriocin-protection, YdeI or OmpD-Associated/Domain of unknown function (DUF1905)